MIATNRLWAARPFLIAYVVAVGFTVGLLINRNPVEVVAVPAVGSGQQTHLTPPDRMGPVRELPLWMQVFRPSPPTARLMLRMALPVLTIADGSAQEAERREFLVYWTGQAAEQPQSLFQTMLPFLRPESPRTVDTRPPGESPGGRLSDGAPGTSGSSPGPATGKTPGNSSGKPADGTNGSSPGASGASSGSAGSSTGDPPRQQPEALGGGLPLVGIYHTHDWESYLSEFPLLHLQRREDLNRVNSESHKQRTIMGIGLRLSEKLFAQGVASVYAKATHQELGYDYAYRSSRSTASKILKEFPSVRILLDLHRDAAWGLDTTAVINGERVAQVRCIIGSEQPRWEQNLIFCEQLMAYAEARYPGLTLPARIQPDTYNQDLMPGAILLEIGNAPNHYAEAERAVDYLARAIADLIRADKLPR